MLALLIKKKIYFFFENTERIKAMACLKKIPKVTTIDNKS